MIICRTPFRISFFGGGTDYPGWYRQHGGAVLAATIDKYCYLTCRYLPPFFEHRIRVVYRKIENCTTIDEISHPAVRETLRYLEHRPRHRAAPRRRPAGPQRHGLQLGVHRRPAARPARPARRDADASSSSPERAFTSNRKCSRETVGSQDQVMAAYGGLRHVTFHPDGEILADPLILPPERVARVEGALDALLHRHRPHRLRRGPQLRRRHRDAAPAAAHHEGTGRREHRRPGQRHGHSRLRRTAARGLAGQAQPERRGVQPEVEGCTSGRGRPAPSAAS